MIIHVYSFLCLCPRYHAEFYYIESSLLLFCAACIVVK